MNIIDIGIVIFILFGAVLGFKRGFTKELVKALGFILIVVLAYYLKNPLSVLMYEHLPFFDFGFLKGAAVLNILLYEIIAFIIVLVILSVVLKLLLLATSVFEKILNATIILGIPSKIGGAIIGIIHHFIIAFIILYILALPFVKFDLLNNSKLANNIINKTPFLSSMIDKTIKVVNEFKDIKDKYDDQSINEQTFNYQTVEVFLKYKLVKPEAIEKLIAKNKIKQFDYYKDLIDNYKGEENGNK
ncbi:MAG: CvpA family protein [Bacilli bacterium]